MKMRTGLSGRQAWRVVEGASRMCRLRRSGARVGSGPRMGSGLRTRARLRADSGNVSAEYAMVTLAACGLAAGLYKVVTSASVTGALESVIGNALDAQF
ncbi:DUF4244 domain-containing protein [Streptomyces sp. IB2014 016-6]|uniref:DUF4244 domain-containing protein n=1 Tax=Streptomyces sp. IB2014 016-6 TaxID=2517818 RepID=UPI001F4F4EDD|nr:DUF4244 domain-containing protein [Streptomyces sp. IB2014 016-6]